MFYNAKEADVTLSNGKMHYVTFGTGNKILVMIPGLRLSGIEGSAKILSMYYRIFVKDYTVYITESRLMFSLSNTLSTGLSFIRSSPKSRCSGATLRLASRAASSRE